MSDLPLQYIVRPAKITQENSPAIFMIHGYGSNKEDLYSFADSLPEEYVVFSLQAPYGLHDFGYAWYALDLDKEHWSDISQAHLSKKQILDFIDKACELYYLDRRKITLLGFSQGCILSLAIALSNPEKISRVVGLSGYLEEKMLEKSFGNKDFSNLKVYISHGISDQIIPVEWARETSKKLQKMGIDCTYEEYPVGHNVSPQNFYSFRDWIKTTDMM